MNIKEKYKLFILDYFWINDFLFFLNSHCLRLRESEQLLVNELLNRTHSQRIHRHQISLTKFTYK